MIADFPESDQTNEYLELPTQDGLGLRSLNVSPVQSPLLLRQAAEQDLLILLRQVDVALHVLLHPPQ